MIFLIGMVLFEYKGAIFWKMTAGMGDIVIAPLYEALRRRGVEFEFFHRLDALHLDAHHHGIDAITMGRQVHLADGVDHYEPLTNVRGLPVFPSAPLPDQIEARPGLDDLESHFGQRDDVETRVLRRGIDFDHVVLAVSLGMIPIVAGELIEDRPEWQEMTTHVRTVATQAFQLWLRPDEPSLGWDEPGVTISAYLRPFETWASMPQTLWAEDWPDDDRPGTVAYFCGSLDATWPTTENGTDYVSRYQKLVHTEAADVHRSQPRPVLPARCRRARVRLAPAQRCERTPWELRVGHPARKREHRSVGPLRAVRSRAATNTGCGRTRAGTTTWSWRAIGPTPE